MRFCLWDYVIMLSCHWIGQLCILSGILEVVGKRILSAFFSAVLF